MCEPRRESSSSEPSTFTRRSLARGAAWATPVAATALAAPAFAASTRFTYTMKGSVRLAYTYTYSNGCSTGGVLTSLTFMNNIPYDEAPAGFSVYETPRLAGTTSPRTNVALTGYRLSIYIPYGAVNTGAYYNGFRFTSTNARGNWSRPELGGVVYLNNYPFQRFDFTFVGAKTGTTVAATQPITPWPGSNTLIGEFAINAICVGSRAVFYWSYVRGFTTSNGDTYSGDTTQSPIRQIMYYGG